MQIQEITGIKQEAQLSHRGRMMPRVVEYYNSVCYEQAASDIVYLIFLQLFTIKYIVPSVCWHCWLGIGVEH